MNTPEEYSAAMQPKLCINCKYIGRNGSGDSKLYKCFAQQNIISRKPDLITGATITEYVFLNCYGARNDYPADLVKDSCGAAGRWFEEAPPKFEEPSRILPGAVKHANSATDLLSQLDAMK